MNEEMIKGNWKIIKGRLKEFYGDLTDDDFREMEGRYDRIVGVIHRRTGIARAEVERRVKEMMKD